MSALPAGTPSILQVLEVVREALHAEVVPCTSNRPQYVVRMACRLLDIVQRELEGSDRTAVELNARVRSVGAQDEADLADGLVEGRFDPADDTVRTVISEMVQWRVDIARPNGPSAGRAGD